MEDHEKFWEWFPVVLTGQGEEQSLTKATQIHVLYFTYRAKVLMFFFQEQPKPQKQQQTPKTGAWEHWVFAEVVRKWEGE